VESLADSLQVAWRCEVNADFLVVQLAAAWCCCCCLLVAAALLVLVLLL